MARNLLPIRILFHAAFAFVYLPIVVLGFTWGLSQDYRGLNSFVKNHFDGITALAALMGLGIFATLDILTIHRKGNQRAFLIIEIIVAVLMPLSMFPIIVSSISVVWTSWFDIKRNYLCFVLDAGVRPSWFCNALSSIRLPSPGDEVTSACVISATVAILALNAAFLLYICIAAATDKFHGNKFLPIYPGESSLSSPEPKRKWYLFGTPRTPMERVATINHCADYIFRFSVFRKHAFEPTIWAIFRGIMAVYACVGVIVFSAYSALSEAQLRGTLTVQETINMAVPYGVLESSWGLSVASFITAPGVGLVNPERNAPPTLTSRNDWQNLDGPGPDALPWQNPIPGFWANNDFANFNMSWSGEYYLVTWVTSFHSSGPNPSDPMPGVPFGDGYLNSTQVNSTNPLVLAPFKQYSISLIAVEYIFPDCRFQLWIPDVLVVDGVSGSNVSVASFSFNGYQTQTLVRDFRPPSIFSSLAHVLSDIGGTLSFIDGLFALVFGRTIVAILFGTRIVSPFGLLGIVTHNRFKRLIHEQYPRMREDIEHGGMAAYISEVAIDAALIDKPSAKGHTGASPVESEADGVDAMELRRRQTGCSTSDLESNSLLDRETDHE